MLISWRRVSGGLIERLNKENENQVNTCETNTPRTDVDAWNNDLIMEYVATLS